MATTPTNKPIPSEDPRDLKFNAGKIDEVVTSNAHYYTDRFGVRRFTIAGFQDTAEEAIRKFGYITMDSFEDGATLTLPNQVLRYESTGEYYRWDGEFPKTVSAASTPENSGGVGFGAWISVGDASLRTELASNDGYKLIPSIQIQRWRDEGDIRGWGCKCDGVTDDTANFQAAINENKLTGKPCRVPEGTTLVGRLTVYSKTTIQGVGQERSFLKLKNGTNAACIYSDGADALWGTQSLGGVDGTIIKNLTIDGNKANNATGSGIALYGFRIRVEGVNIINCGRNGMRTEWADSGNASGGMEGSFKNILIDKSGEDGWRFAGPHDSVCSDIIIISSGQNTASTYSGLWLERGNARWSGVHCWTSADDARSKYALKVSRPAEGNEFDTSHFEGADTNVFVEANNFNLSESCKVYYPWSGANIVLAGSSARISCYIGEEYKGIGLPPAIGVQLAGGFGGVSGSVIDCIANGQDGGTLYVGDSAGYNSIRIRGYTSSTTHVAVQGTPHATDDLDVVVSGAKAQIVRKVVKADNVPIAVVTAAGGGQATATGYGNTASRVFVEAGGVGTGVKLTSTTDAGDGYSVIIYNGTAQAVNVYPVIGQQILGLGVNNPYAIAPLSAAEFTVVRASLGQYAVMKGA